MEPQQKITISETTPTVESGSAPVGIESSPIAEVVSQSPAQPTVNPDPVVEPIVAQVPIQDDVTITPEEVKDLADSDIEVADRDWVKQVREVIKEDSGLPYKEEEDAETLNEKYMHDRFNVDVDAPIEEK